MLCVKPYLLWKEMKAVQREGYRGLPGNDDDYSSRHDDLEGEEEGRPIVADTDDEHVRFFKQAICTVLVSWLIAVIGATRLW
jgi:hypothetical protein